jgi:hypothetical protein
MTRTSRSKRSLRLFLGDLDRDFASEPGIEGFVYLPMPPRRGGRGSDRVPAVTPDPAAKTLLALERGLVGHVLDVVLREPHPFHDRRLEMRIGAKARERRSMRSFV